MVLKHIGKEKDTKIEYMTLFWASKYSLHSTSGLKGPTFLADLSLKDSHVASTRSGVHLLAKLNIIVLPFTILSWANPALSLPPQKSHVTSLLCGPKPHFIAENGRYLIQNLFWTRDFIVYFLHSHNSVSLLFLNG